MRRRSVLHRAGDLPARRRLHDDGQSMPGAQRLQRAVPAVRGHVLHGHQHRARNRGPRDPHQQELLRARFERCAGHRLRHHFFAGIGGTWHRVASCPAAPTVTSLNAAVVGNTVNVSGTASDPNGDITVVKLTISSAFSSTPPITVSASGTPRSAVSVALAPGDYTVVAQAFDAPVCELGDRCRWRSAFCRSRRPRSI